MRERIGFLCVTALALATSTAPVPVATAATASADPEPGTATITLWKELEELLPASGWSPGAWRPAKLHDKRKFWTGTGGARSDERGNAPLVWRFRLKEEMTADGLDPLVRTYAVWVHQYGYRDRELTASLDGKPVGTIVSNNTETLDDKGKYVSGGHYIWQKLGEVTMAGGAHELALRAARGQRVLLNALALTTDLSLTPQYHELKDATTEGFAVSAPAEWRAYLKSAQDVYGLTPGFTSMSWFVVGHSGKGRQFGKDARAVITLPEGVTLTTASQRLVGVDWVYPKARYEKYNRLTIKPQAVRRDGKPCTQYTIALSYVPDHGHQGLMLYLRTALPPGTRPRGYAHLQWEDGRSDEEEVHFKVVAIPKTKGFRNILVGAAGGRWDHVLPVKWPDFPDLLTHCGLNATCLWGICGKVRADLELRQDTIRKFLDKGLQTLDEFSPWYQVIFPPPTIEEGAAADIDGKLYKDYKDRTAPCPTYIDGNPHIEQQLERVRTIARLGITGLMFDDERFNLKGADICFCPRCKTGYRAYLAEHHPHLDPIDLSAVVRQEAEYPRHYEAWLIFRALGNTRRLTRMHQAFVEVAATSGHKSVFAEDPFTVAIISVSGGKLRTMRESKLWDTPSLAKSPVVVCPMIYPTKVKHLSGSTIPTLRNIRRDMRGEGTLWVTLNCGYAGGEVMEEHKEVIQYGTLEALMRGCKSVTYWNGFATHDPLSLEQIAAAVRLMAPYEELLLRGDAAPDFADCADREVNLAAVTDGNRALLLVSNYAENPPEPATVNVPGNVSHEVVDARTGRTVARLSADSRTLAVSFGAQRAHLFELRAP